MFGLVFIALTAALWVVTRSIDTGKAFFAGAAVTSAAWLLPIFARAKATGFFNPPGEGMGTTFNEMQMWTRLHKHELRKLKANTTVEVVGTSRGLGKAFCEFLSS